MVSSTNSLSVFTIFKKFLYPSEKLKIISFSYEDYYEKVYTIKVSKEELYKEINATLKQKKRL